MSRTEIHNPANVTSSARSRDGFHLDSTTQHELPGKNKVENRSTWNFPQFRSRQRSSTSTGPGTLLGRPWAARQRFPRLLGYVSSAVELLHLHSLGLMSQGFSMNVKAGRSAVLHRVCVCERESVWLQQREYEPAVVPVRASLSGSTTLLYIFSVYRFVRLRRLYFRGRLLSKIISLLLVKRLVKNRCSSTHSHTRTCCLLIHT